MKKIGLILSSSKIGFIMNSQALSRLFGWLSDADKEEEWLNVKLIKIHVVALIKRFLQPPMSLWFLGF